MILPEKVRQENPNILGFTYRNINMLINVVDGMVTASFQHPTRYPTMEEMRIMIQRIIPNKNLYIPINLHTIESHMVTAIELPGEVRKGSEDVKKEIEVEAQATTESGSKTTTEVSGDNSG